MLVNEFSQHIGEKIYTPIWKRIYKFVIVEYMNEAKKRYDKKYPVVSVRISKELKEYIDKHRRNKSYSEIIKEALEKFHKLHEIAEKNFWQGYEKGWQEGYEIGYQNGSEEGYNKGYNEGYEKGRRVAYQNGFDEGYQKGYDDGRQDAVKEMEPKLQKLKEYEEEERMDYFNRMMNKLLRKEEKYIQALRILKGRLMLLHRLKKDADAHQVSEKYLDLYIKLGDKLNKIYEEIKNGLEEIEHKIKFIWLKKEIEELIEEKKKEDAIKNFKMILELQKLRK